MMTYAQLSDKFGGCWVKARPGIGALAVVCPARGQAGPTLYVNARGEALEPDYARDAWELDD